MLNLTKSKMENKKEKFFWADQIADQIIKERPGKEFVCASGITPSGKIHIGNFREIITTDLVVKALEDKGKKVRFIYSWDDFDRFRKVPKGVDSSYEKYLGMPLSEFPSPFDKKKTYAEFNEKELEDSLKKVGIKPKFIYQNVMNKKYKYAELIKVALEKRKEIMEILDKYRKESLAENWMPIAIYCGKCKKDSTKILNVEDYEIEYECSCGNKEKIDFRKEGFISIKWRVDWPLRWKYENVVFEPGGIDHSVEGGSYTTAKEISKKIFDFDPPIYTFYDWIKPKGGKEFSSSAGNVLTIDDVEEIYEVGVLRYLFAGTRPNKGFEISFDNDVIKIYDDFDELERKYYSKEGDPKEKRMYEMSVLKSSKIKPKRTSFRHMVTLVQTGKTKGLNKEDKIRAEKVKNWLYKYGSEMSFKLQEKINLELSDKQKQALISLKEVLSDKKVNEDSLFEEFYNIAKASEMSTKEFFETVYSVIIGKTKGPRLASLILSIGKDKIIKLLEQI